MIIPPGTEVLVALPLVVLLAQRIPELLIVNHESSFLPKTSLWHHRIRWFF
jgi:hypothetical protein